MPRLNLILFILLGALSARAADVRLALMGGFGASLVSINGNSQNESPLAMAGLVDTTISQHMTLGLEHARTISMSPISTGVSTSGIFARYYLMNRPPATPIEPDGGVSYLSQRAIGGFLGLGTGLAQSSLYPKADSTGFTNSVTVYLKLRAGFDYPIAPRWGVQSEGIIGASLFGDGQITTVQVVAGIYYLL